MSAIQTLFNGRLTYDLIISCIQATTRAQHGKEPTASSKKVYVFGPNGKPRLLKGLTWSGLNLAIRDGRHGLPKPGDWNYLNGLSALKDFMRNGKRFHALKSIPLPESLSYAWILACNAATKAATGKELTPSTRNVFAPNPAKKKGVVRVSGATGAKIDDYIANGDRGLPKRDDPDYLYGLGPLKKAFRHRPGWGRAPTL